MEVTKIFTDIEFNSKRILEIANVSYYTNLLKFFFKAVLNM